MTDLHPPPVDQLLTLGEPDYRGSWRDYLQLALTPEHVPALVTLMEDPRLSWEACNEEDDATPFWAPLHAWRALGQLRAEAAAEPLVKALLRAGDDDWASADIPLALAMIGPAALGPVRDALPAAAREPEPWTAGALAGTLVKIAEANPEVREQVVEILTRQLRIWPNQSEELNAFLIAELIDLRAVESASVIQEAFEAGAVDEFVSGDWEDVQAELGLIEKRTTPRPRYDHEIRIFVPPKIIPSVPGSDSAAAKSRKLRRAQKEGKKKGRR